MENGEDPPAAVELPNTDTVLDVLKTRDWIDGQNYDLAVALRAEQLELLETQDVEELQERIASHQADLLKISDDHAVKKQALKRTQFDQILCDKMFTEPLQSYTSADTTTATDTATATDRRKLEPLLEERNRLTSAILRKKENVEELQKELDAVRKRNFDLKGDNRALMSELSQHRKKLERMADRVKGDAAYRELKEELESIVSHLQIAKCTMQALVVGSGVNWVHDPALLDTMMLCGDHDNL